MAKPRMDLTALVDKLLEEQDGDVLREGIRVLSQALMEKEVAGLIGAERYEPTGARTAYRDGARTRTWDYAGRHDCADHSKGAAGHVFSLSPAAPVSISPFSPPSATTGTVTFRFISGSVCSMLVKAAW